jgi:hypothetical protein
MEARFPSFPCSLALPSPRVLAAPFFSGLLLPLPRRSRQAKTDTHAEEQERRGNTAQHERKHRKQEVAHMQQLHRTDDRDCGSPTCGISLAPSLGRRFRCCSGCSMRRLDLTFNELIKCTVCTSAFSAPSSRHFFLSPLQLASGSRLSTRTFFLSHLGTLIRSRRSQLLFRSESARQASCPSPRCCTWA